MKTNSTFKNRILELFGFQPTTDQEVLFKTLADFTFSELEREVLIVRGYAGTGKTTAMSAYINSLKGSGFKAKILAPTGRAAKVIGRASKQEAFTIHKQIYRRKSKADFNAPLSLNINLYKRTVFIVDESSMIADYSMDSKGKVNERNLLDDLLEYVFSGKECKLIFMGDEGQLPPVGSDFSPALNKKYLAEMYPSLNVRVISLSQVQRQQEGSSVLMNATRLRSNHDSSFLFDLNSKKQDLVRLEGGMLQDEIENSMNQFGFEGTIIVTRSNKRANLYNEQIRRRILWFEDELCQGDCLMVVKNNYYWIGDDSKMGFIANGELLKLHRILKYEEVYGFKFVRASVSFIDYEEVGEVEVILMPEVLHVEAPSLSRDRMRELFFEVEKDYAHIRNKKERYEKILANPYFNALQIKYAYAVTCHKAQGGQWNHVYIDPGFVPKEQQDSSYYRWLYTALTRATDKVYLVNFSEEFFIEGQ